MPSRSYNPEKRAWRGKSYKKGRERVPDLRDKALIASTAEASTDMSTTELCRVLKTLGFQGDVEGFVQTCDEDEIKELLLDLSRASGMTYDMSELGGEPGDPPTTLEEFLRVNDECPPDPSELAELVTVPVGGTVNLGIGGGFVTVRRVS